jgi:MoaA/NifB/PqqE/SkfB family radical SAM enzyme
VNCPHCNKQIEPATLRQRLSPDEIKSLWAWLCQSRRTVKTGGHGGGRPLGVKDSQPRKRAQKPDGESK